MLLPAKQGPAGGTSAGPFALRCPLSVSLSRMFPLSAAHASSLRVALLSCPDQRIPSFFVKGTFQGRRTMCHLVARFSLRLRVLLSCRLVSHLSSVVLTTWCLQSHCYKDATFEDMIPPCCRSWNPGGYSWLHLNGQAGSVL